MSVRKLKPVTAGQRFRVVNNFDELTINRPEKSLIFPISKTGGRNNSGKMTVRCKGGGHKRKLRLIDFKRDKKDIPALVKTVEYDPNRSSFISLLSYADGEKRYIVCPSGLKVGSSIVATDGPTSDISTGNFLKLKHIPLGTHISCIEIKDGQGSKLVRSAGNYAQLLARDGKYATIKMPSNEIRLILVECRAMIGSVSNSDHQLLVSGKAGRSRWLGIRPRTRPVAMNPVDHPMGGGEGRSSGGHPRSRNNIPAKGYKTRSKNKYSNKYILQKRK